LLHAFKYRQTFNMIFPWADGGNLLNLWDSISKVGLDEAFDWFWAQCINLAEATAATHARRVLHGDIKPENVLCFTPKDGGEMATSHSPILYELRLGDFGISTRVSDRDSKAERNWVWHAPTQRPPERDVEMGGVGLPADIWSLGCLYLDFATWLLLGNDKLLAFAQSRESELGDPDGEGNPIEEDTYFKVLNGSPKQTGNGCQGTRRAEVKDRVSEVRTWTKVLGRLFAAYVRPFLRAEVLTLCTDSRPRRRAAAKRSLALHWNMLIA
jgi:serine/threonine protein kinase